MTVIEKLMHCYWLDMTMITARAACVTSSGQDLSPFGLQKIIVAAAPVMLSIGPSFTSTIWAWDL
uniref:Uncharacterized protein n=1 Tax=Setaria digitata TaxID=48799 RepID=A0A915Q7Y1_9BILA